MAYYYLISSLPMLRADRDLPLSYGEFLDTCRASLSESKYKMLEELTLLSNEGPLVSEWSRFYRVLHEELTYQRNLRLGRKATPPSISEESISRLVSSAMNNKNPLAAEEMLLEFEFSRLDELVGVHYFDDHALIGYALKLLLLERKKSFVAEKGKAEFGRMIEKLEDEIKSMESGAKQ